MCAELHAITDIVLVVPKLPDFRASLVMCMQTAVNTLASSTVLTTVTNATENRREKYSHEQIKIVSVL